MTADVLPQPRGTAMANVPSHQNENILVATIGTSPAVLTETVWALAHRSSPVVIDRVIVITTKRGRADLQSKLLEVQSSPWVRLKQVLQEAGHDVQGKLRLDPSDIRIIEANGQELEDIRSTADNRVVGNQILHILLNITANPRSTVFASLAGGRKTMSSLLFSSMSVCARPQDRVLHVLVNEPFDNPRLSPPFYFPDPKIEYHEFVTGNTRRISPQDAKIELAEIPIPSLREFLDFVPESDRRNLTLEGVAHVVRRGSEEAVTQRLFNQPINVADCLRKTPLLKWLGELLPQRHNSLGQPFSDYHVLLVLHCLTNLVSFTWAMQQLGLKKATFFIKEYPYPQKQTIRKWLKHQSYETVDLNEDTLKGSLSKLINPEKLLIVEDGGWITKTILESFPNLRSRVVGVMEQTTKGLWRIQEAINNLPEDQQTQLFPILLLPYSSHKLEFEPLHIGRGIVRAIDQMISDYLDGMYVGLFGYGTIGKQVANSLVDMGARVTVYDPEYTSRVSQISHTHVTFATDPEEAVKNKRLIIGCSGKASIDEKVIAMIRGKGDSPVYIASGSSEKVEINIAALKRTSTGSQEFRHEYLMVGGELLRLGTEYHLPLAKIVLLADGMPVNFMGLGGMKDPAADFIMSLMFAGAYQLACRRINGNGLLCDEKNSCVDRICDEIGIEAKFDEFMKQGY